MSKAKATVWNIKKGENGIYYLFGRPPGSAGTVKRSLRTRDATQARINAIEIDKAEAAVAAPHLKVVDLWETYQEHLGDRPAGVTMGYEGKAILPFFGDKLPIEVDEALCDKYIKQRRAYRRTLSNGELKREGTKDGTILTELVRLSSCFNYAVQMGTLPKKPRMKFPTPPEPKDIHLTREEWPDFYDAIIAPHVKLFATLALTTGARSSAILQLTWDRVNFRRNQIDLRVAGRDMKGRAIVPINETLLEALTEAKAEAERVKAKSPLVVTCSDQRIMTVKKGIKEAGRRAGLAGITPHVLRHTAAVWMAEDGQPMSEIAQFLGHASEATTFKVYARYSPTHLAKAAASLNFQRRRA